jgi:hypothetical protein
MDKNKIGKGLLHKKEYNITNSILLYEVYEVNIRIKLMKFKLLKSLQLLFQNILYQIHGIREDYCKTS